MIRPAAPIGLKSAITSVLVTCIVIALNTRATAADVADGPALMQKVRDDIAWVGELKSFHLMARIEERRTPEGIEKDLRALKRQFPGSDQFDPLEFTQLLPEINSRLELDFDTRRLRNSSLSRDDMSRELSRNLWMWDGRRTVYHDQCFHPVRDRVLFRSKIDLARDRYWGWFMYLNQHPLVCWWHDTQEQREQLQRGYGEASNFVLVDRANFHEVDCHVLLEARHSYVNRYYIGVQDGRCIGIKKGVATYATIPNFAADNKRLLGEFLDKSFGASPSDEDWKAMHQELEDLPAVRRAAWGKQFYSEIGKQLSPVWEIWYSDFRDLGEGHSLPFRETFLFFGFDETKKKIFVSNQRTVFVRNVTLNQPLDDSLFEEAIADGAEIIDETTKPK